MRAVAALLALMLLPAPALASHLGQYQYNPVEHDDQGRSAEPDRLSTSVLGIPVANRVVDADLDHVAEPDAAFATGAALAPGCTGPSGEREASGRCGLWTVGLSNPTLGVRAVERHTQGIPKGIGPGLTGKGARTVRFLDARTDIHVTFNLVVGSTYLALNEKLRDLGATEALIAPGTVALWAWYGTWSDRNGNGVIDHLGQDTEESGALYEDNEFVWGGACTAFDGAPPPPGGYPWCVPDPAPAKAWAYVWPGNHHAFCRGYIEALATPCSAFPADAPGRQVIGYADAMAPDAFGAGPIAIGSGCTTPFSTDWDNPTGCQDDLDRADRNDELAWGDPLLGPQDSLRPDGAYVDRAGDAIFGVRHLVYGDGWPVWFYDQSVASATVVVTALGCPPDPGSLRGLDLPSCRFLDVDRYESLHPALDQLAQQTVKPAAREAWVRVRDATPAMAGHLDWLADGGLLRAPPLAEHRGFVNDQVIDPGWAREPNTGPVAFAGGVEDHYPGALRGVCTGPDAAERTFRGWCNGYDGYQVAPHAWADVASYRQAMHGFPLHITPGAQCIQCVSGGLISIPAHPEPSAPIPRPPGDHGRTLGPGSYGFLGFLGTWRDAPQTWIEDSFDVATLSTRQAVYTHHADGWVGNIVNATGTYYDRGYTDQDCITDQGAGPHTYAECDPYLGGTLENPQQGGQADHGEFALKRCDTRVGEVDNILIDVYPEGGVWTVPVHVWRDAYDGFALVDPDGPGLFPGLVLEERTGTAGPIRLRAECSASGETGFFRAQDLLLLPHGNLGLDVATVLTTSAATDPVAGMRETVVDVDLYRGWGV